MFLYYVNTVNTTAKQTVTSKTQDNNVSSENTISKNTSTSKRT